jgi:glycosyltransferase involved in cell wall biosynthesis
MKTHPIFSQEELNRIKTARISKNIFGKFLSGKILQALAKFKLYEQTLSTYYVLNTSPIIIYIGNVMKYTFQIAELFKDEKVIFIKNSYHTFEREDRLLSLAQEVKVFYELYPQHHLYFICPTKTECDLFDKNGIKNSHFINKNAFIDESMFYIMPQIKKKFDAIYNAQLKPYKRFELARHIRKIAIITYQAHRFNESALNTYSQTIKEQLSKATWLNNIDNFIPPCDVVRYLNQAKVGLCLSAEEGPMMASMEYLLCGLPIVSTKSLGGREVFFDDSYVEIVDDDPKKVSEAVKFLISRNISPELIRKTTLEKIQIHRNKFIDLINKILRNEGKKDDFKESFDKLFINKLRISGTFPGSVLMNTDERKPMDMKQIKEAVKKRNN